MATETDINGIPMPELSDIANIETAIQPSLEAIDLLLPSSFASVSARDATITSPQFGMISSVEATGETYTYDGSKWIGLRPRLFYHATTQFFDTTSFEDVNDFSMPLEANSKYIMRGSLVVSTTQPAETNDIGFGWSYPSGLTGDWIIRAGLVSDGGSTHNDFYRVKNLEFSSQQTCPTPFGAYFRFDLEGVAITAATAGSLTLRACEASSTAGSAAVMQDSYITLHKVV